MRHLYRLKCPNCGYEYQYEGEEYELEHCPYCPNAAPFKDCVQEVRDEVGKT